MNEKEIEYLVQINYKSGNSVELWFAEFDISSNKASWKISSRYNGETRILLLGIDEIESVIQLAAETVEAARQKP